MTRHPSLAQTDVLCPLLVPQTTPAIRTQATRSVRAPVLRTAQYIYTSPKPLLGDSRESAAHQPMPRNLSPCSESLFSLSFSCVLFFGEADQGGRLGCAHAAWAMGRGTDMGSMVVGGGCKRRGRPRMHMDGMAWAGSKKTPLRVFAGSWGAIPGGLDTTHHAVHYVCSTHS